MNCVDVELNEAGELIGISATMYTIPIPIEDNDQKPFADDLIAQVHADLVDCFGGLTCTAGSGFWINDGRMYEDKLSVVQAVSTDPDVETFLAEWAVQTAKLLDQVDESIYIFSQQVYIRQPEVTPRSFVQPTLPLTDEDPVVVDQSYYASTS